MRRLVDAITFEAILKKTQKKKKKKEHPIKGKEKRTFDLVCELGLYLG